MNGFKLISGIAGSTFIDNAQISEFFSGYPIAWMNGVFRIDGNSSILENLIRDTVAKYGGTPMIWRLGEITPNKERVAELLLKNGLKFSGSEPGMVLDLNKLHYSEPVPGLTVKMLEYKQQIPDWLDQFASVFDLPADAKSHFDVFIQGNVGCVNDQAWFVGYVDDVPVSTSYYLIDSGVTMIYNVGTINGYRKKGCGRRVVEAAIDHALKISNDPITLYASEMGRPLYEDMGFVEVYRYNEYTLNK